MSRRMRRGRGAERQAPPGPALPAGRPPAAGQETPGPRLAASLAPLPAEPAGRRPPADLAIGRPGGVVERQAEGVADRVAGRPAAAGAASARGAPPPVPPGLAETLAHAGPGAPLSTPLRDRIEPVLGHALSGVRVHDDAAAHAAAASIGATAFTWGDDIWLGAGQSAGDPALMAHEAAHAVQQRGAGSGPPLAAPGAVAGSATAGLIQRQALDGGAPDVEILGPVYPSPAQWQARALQRAGIDIRQWRPDRGFAHNWPIIEKVYRYYAWLHGQDSDLLWAGMAKLAGGEVLRGLREAQQTIDNARINRRMANWADPGERSFIAGLDLQAGYARTLQTRLILMQKHIFEDLAWQHQAYVEAGLPALEYAHANRAEVPIGAWRDIASGNAARVRAGNRALLRREQEEVLRDDYRYIRDIPDFDAIPALMSALAQSPLPGGRPFRDVVPDGDITAFDDRWRWIERDMLPAYEGLSPERRRALIGTSLEDLSRRRFPPARRRGEEP